MIIDIILISIIIICLGGIIFILVRKLPFLSTLNPEQFSQVQQVQVKNLILKGRLKRRFAELKGLVNHWWSNLNKKIGNKF